MDLVDCAGALPACMGDCAEGTVGWNPEEVFRCVIDCGTGGVAACLGGCGVIAIGVGLCECIPGWKACKIAEDCRSAYDAGEAGLLC